MYACSPCITFSISAFYLRAKLVRTFDHAARSVAVEVDVPNDDGRLRPGLYVTVVISIPRERPGVVVPDEAILFNGQGLRVAVVDKDDTVRMQDVTIARDQVGIQNPTPKRLNSSFNS